MTALNVDDIRRFTGSAAEERLSQLEVFAEIDSTNTYLMQKPGPDPGKMFVVLAHNQTAGRGRHGKTWQSPPGSGLCLSAAYTFAVRPDNVSALTLAIGLSAMTALEDLGANNVQLKWPNDLVANDGKLAGILTEVQPNSGSSMTVVTGIGVNVNLPPEFLKSTEEGSLKRVVDLNSLCDTLPQREQIAGDLVTHLCNAFVQFESGGFGEFAEQWEGRDWLLGREIIVETADRQVSGVGAGIAVDGALLLDTPDSGVRRITAGSIVLAETRAPAL